MAENDSNVEYRDVQGFPGYRVGSDGSVWSCWTKKVGRGYRYGWKIEMGDHWRQMKPWLTGGYPTVCLHRPSLGPKTETKVRVSRLVLTTFIGACPDGMEACHDPDPTPSNCQLNNLRWDTPKNNHADKRKHGTALLGESHQNHKLTEDEVHTIRSRKGVEPQHTTALEFDIADQTVGKIQSHKAWAWLPERKS